MDWIPKSRKTVYLSLPTMDSVPCYSIEIQSESVRTVECLKLHNWHNLLMLTSESSVSTIYNAQASLKYNSVLAKNWAALVCSGSEGSLLQYPILISHSSYMVLSFTIK